MTKRKIKIGASPQTPYAAPFRHLRSVVVPPPSQRRSSIALFFFFFFLLTGLLDSKPTKLKGKLTPIENRYRRRGPTACCCRGTPSGSPARRRRNCRRVAHGQNPVVHRRGLKLRPSQHLF